ncbi:MAG: ATP-binding protein [bacterium]|nr:ATP-binding protein [bacterium]
MVNFLVVLGVISIFNIYIAIGYLLLGEGGTKEQKLMGYFLCGSLVQNAGYLMELTAKSLDVAVLAVKIEYLGSLFVPLFYCWFIFNYCYIRRPVWLLKLVAGINFCLLAVIFTCEYHTLYYRELEWIAGEGRFSYLGITYGPCYFVFLICSSIIPYSLSLFALLRTVLRSSAATKRRYEIIMLLSTLPVVTLAAYALKLTGGYDFTPATMGIVLAVVVILVWSRRNYDFVHLAAETAIAHMGDGVISLDDQQRIISYNQAAAGIFKELHTSAKGDSIAEIKEFPPDILGKEDKHEFSMGDRFYESHVRQIPDKNGKTQGYVVLLLDITDTRNYIDEIKRVREQAEKANAAKSEFLANMSHEIRTPMNAVIGLSDIIMEESQGRKVYGYACDIKSASQNLLAIINDILDLSKVEAGKMELVMSDYYIKGIVGDVVGMMDIVASQRGLLMKHEYEEDIPCRYEGDEGRIKQIMINLLNNALKFTKEGYVKLSVSGQPGGSEDEELLTFRVEDTGCGIQKEDLEKIFDNFSQVDTGKSRSVEGTGLGLAITKQFVQLMNGSIHVESVYGEGSAFTVTIPQKIVDRRTLEEVRDVPVEKEQEPKHFKTSGCRVLVVDDNAVNRKVAKGYLAPYGLELTEAQSGPEAIELVKENAYDLIFMDHMMPGMDGIEAVHIIRRECGENGKNAVIIAATANAMEGVKGRFLENGFQDFIPKPIDKKHLYRTLAKWIPEEKKIVPPEKEDGNDAEGTAAAGGNVSANGPAGVTAAQNSDTDARGSAPMNGSPDAAYETGYEDAQTAADEIVIQGIDVAAAMEHHSGSLDDYRELLQLYCLEGKRKLKLIKELFDEKDYKNYEIEVHGLKSASANVGAMRLSKMAKEHEMAAVQGDEEFISDHFLDLYESYGVQLRYIQVYLDRAAQKDAEPEEGALAEDVLFGQVGKALEKLEAFHSRECADIVAELLKHHMESDVKARLLEIQEQLQLYEDDEAEELLRQLRERLHAAGEHA